MTIDPEHWKQIWNSYDHCSTNVNAIDDNYKLLMHGSSLFGLFFSLSLISPFHNTLPLASGFGCISSRSLLSSTCVALMPHTCFLKIVIDGISLYVLMARSGSDLS